MTMLAQFAAAAGGALPAYIEDVFSTYLYTGTGAGVELDINNGIDLATEGGMLWCRSRNNEQQNWIFDTNRNMSYAAASILNSATADAQTGGGTNFIKPTTTGFTLGTSAGSTSPKTSGYAYASWTFRKQPKFFDVVTYTGDGVVGRAIPHNLGSVPGCMIVKRLNGIAAWRVYHRSLGATQSIYLNYPDAAASATVWNNTAPTSTEFTVSDNSNVNGSGDTYVAYLYAHDAGGFGLSGSENVVSCGAFSTDSGGKATVNLGYEPQWVMFKRTDSDTFGNWYMIDNMRGFTNPSGSSYLFANTIAVEATGINFAPEATGFNINFTGPANWIYIAIRRGPMKVPTLGTTVYNAIARTGTGAAATVTGVGFTPDWLFTKSRSNVTGSMVADRLRGEPYLQTNTTGAETTNTAIIDSTAFSTTMDGFRLSGSSTLNNFSPYTYINYLFKRAPSFFDEVCYTGTGSLRTVAHNLSVAPELMIVKNRASAGNWSVWDKTIFAANPANILRLQSDYFADPDNSYFNSTAPTASVFTVNTENNVNMSGAGIVAYLFATCAGVSKVGSYTGTGATQAINCGFTAGARFVLIKRTDNLGDWYYWDSTRGIVAGNDPYLLMNTTAAEVTGTDYVDTSATGFELSSTAPAAINASGGSYIFLAVA